MSACPVNVLEFKFPIHLFFASITGTVPNTTISPQKCKKPKGTKKWFLKFRHIRPTHFISLWNNKWYYNQGITYYKSSIGTWTTACSTTSLGSESREDLRTWGKTIIVVCFSNGINLAPFTDRHSNRAIVAFLNHLCPFLQTATARYYRSLSFHIDDLHIASNFSLNFLD